MTQSYGPVQRKILAALTSARTVEPYPIWMTWRGLAARVYGRTYAVASDIANVRRAARDMRGTVTCFNYTNGKLAGAGLRLTPEHQWLLDQVTALAPQLGWAVDSRNYRPPTAAEVQEAFRRGCLADGEVRVDLTKVTGMVNAACKSAFDPSEIAWQRLGREELNKQKKAQELSRLAAALRQHASRQKRLEAEARMITLGPFRVDPTAIEFCPCCQQGVSADRMPELRANLLGVRRPSLIPT
ncbi:hypothetical protein ACIQOW_07180 [Kitasatospora sp. NPDC091335]|uniref:hypothetical protein n=1 Tax=Kitasatospora sp. NPDC091335 TaxID=3364085 RepID=UPI0038073900